jgi:GTP-binding protein LepA
MDGSIKIGDKIKMLATNAVYEVTSLGIHNPYEQKCKELTVGEVGFLAASIKSIEDVKVGDTITLENANVLPIEGYKPMKPMVFCGIYPIESNKFEDLKEALEKLKLNDASLEFTPETSEALGFGFRCGFLGLLHMEIIEERIERVLI